MNQKPEPVCRFCRFLSDQGADSGICLNQASEHDGCLRLGTETCRQFTAPGVHGVLVVPR